MPVAACRRRTRRDEATTASVIGVHGSFVMAPVCLWAVILCVMSDTKHVVLIHGMWSRGEQYAPARAAFEERGYVVHTPTLRHHELPLHECAMKIASLSLRNYTDDLVTLVASLDSPPLLVGHSLGGLLAHRQC